MVDNHFSSLKFHWHSGYHVFVHEIKEGSGPKRFTGDSHEYSAGNWTSISAEV
ncbi:hypothetical protein BDP27DRAFT_1331930, partial [Rhodocollybia butyracea]